MDRNPSLKPVQYSRLARRHLGEIWNRNADEYSPLHADSYVPFIRHPAERLAFDLSLSKTVPTRPEYRYLTARRKRSGHGHVIVFAERTDSTEVLAIYHTRQDWQGKIERGDLRLTEDE